MKTKDIGIIFLICIFVFILKYDGYPVSNFLEKFPQAYHDKYPEFYKNDFLVQSSLNLEIRKIFINVFNFVDHFIGNYEFTHALLLFITIFLFSLGFYKVVHLITGNEELSLFSLIFPLIFSVSKIGIGNIFMISNFLDSIKFAWVFTIWALYFHIKNKNILAFLLLGISSMFHVVFGLIMFGVFILSMIYFKEFKKLYSSVFFMLPFSIINIPLYLSELKTSINDPALLYYILFVFRAPHHYLPHKWPLMNWIYFIGFFIIFLIIFYKFSKIDEKFKKRFNVFIYIIVFYYIIAIIFSSIFPINFIIKLQLFRISEFLNVIQFIFVGEFIYNYIYKRFSIFIKSSLIFLSILFVLIYTFYNPIFERGDFDKDSEELFNFIKVNTGKDDIFLSPPYISTIRSGSLRAIVVDKKSEPVSESALLEWYNRMMDVTKNQSSLRDEDLKMSYNSLNEYDIDILKEKYRFSFAIFEKPKKLFFPVFYENDKYIVYDLRNYSLSQSINERT